MSDQYINLGDFEKFVRDRFHNIVFGKGITIPRVAVKIALDDVFRDEESQRSNALDHAKKCVSCGKVLQNPLFDACLTCIVG